MGKKHGTVGEPFRTAHARRINELRPAVSYDVDRLYGRIVYGPGRILEQLEKVLSSSVFRRADRSSALLRFIVEQTLRGKRTGSRSTPSIRGSGSWRLVRSTHGPDRACGGVQAAHTPGALHKTIGRADPVLLLLPKGNYVAQFTSRTSTTAPRAQHPGR